MDIVKKIKTVLGSISNLIGVAIVTNTDNDDSLDQVVQVTESGKPIDVLILSPYGLSSNLPQGASIFKMQIDGAPESQVGIGSFPENRFRDLKLWEVALGNYKTKAHVRFQDNGEIVFKLDNEKASDDFLVRFNKLEEGFLEFRSDYNNTIDKLATHTHLIAALPNPSGATIPTAVPTYTPPVTAPSHSSASIADAKITAMRAPTDD